jgi:hypothetical protein
MKHLLVTLALLSLCLTVSAQQANYQSQAEAAVAATTTETNDSIPNFTDPPKVQMRVQLQHEGPYGDYGSYDHVIQLIKHMKKYLSAFKNEYKSLMKWFPAALEIFKATEIDLNNKPNAYFTGQNYGTTNEINANEYTAQISSTLVDSHDWGRYGSKKSGYSNQGDFVNVMAVSVGDTTYQLEEKWRYTPIILDMDGDGKLEASKGQYKPHDYTGVKVLPFDINGDNFDDMIEWVGANDGLLLQYKPGEKVNGNHLFGNAGGWNHGFEKLGTLDANKDGMLKGEELATLSVWQDKNRNAVVDSGEVRTVKALGITMIKVTHTEDLVSSFEQNGTLKKMWDWYPTCFKATKKRK